MTEFREKGRHLLENAHNEVVARLLRDVDWRFASLVVEKARINPSIREPKTFYPKFAGMLLRFIFRGRIRPGTDRLLIYTDTLPIRKKREAVEKAIKTSCRGDLRRGIQFHVYHHPRQSNAWLQAVDYCCWAVYRKWHRGDTRTYDSLRPRLAVTELEVTRRGDMTYY